jgi:hypothetical protein
MTTHDPIETKPIAPPSAAGTIFENITEGQLLHIEKTFSNINRLFWFILLMSVWDLVMILLNSYGTLTSGIGTLLVVSSFFAEQGRSLGWDITTLRIVVGLCNGILLAGCAVLVYFATRRHMLAYRTAILLYLLDTFVFVQIGLWYSVAAHIFCLFLLNMGHIHLGIIRKLTLLGYLPRVYEPFTTPQPLTAPQLTALTNISVTPITTPSPISNTAVQSVKIGATPPTTPFDWGMVRAGVLVFIVPVVLIGFVLWLVLPK